MRWPVAEIPRRRRHVQWPALVQCVWTFISLCLAFRQTTPARCTICPHVHLSCQLLQSTARMRSVICHQVDTSHGKDPILDVVCRPRSRPIAAKLSDVSLSTRVKLGLCKFSPKTIMLPKTRFSARNLAQIFSRRWTHLSSYSCSHLYRCHFAAGSGM